MNTIQNSHQFALYTMQSFLETISVGKEFILTDTAMVQRIISILRLEIGESFIIFNKEVHAVATITNRVKNKSVTLIFDKKTANAVLKPHITLLLPLLKKDALETALYSLVELGANTIQLVTTAKSNQKWSIKEHERAQRIIIAAAEQSKHFASPTLLMPSSLTQVLEKISPSDVKICFDPAGLPLSVLFKDDQLKKSVSFILAIGPEGDFTPDEKNLFGQHNFSNYALTPTILRASQAAALGLGIIRSLI